MSWKTLYCKVLDIEYRYEEITEYEDRYGTIHTKQAYRYKDGYMRGCHYNRSEACYNEVTIYAVSYTLLTVVNYDGVAGVLMCEGKAPVQISDEITVKIFGDYGDREVTRVTPEELLKGNVTRQRMIDDFVNSRR